MGAEKYISKNDQAYLLETIIVFYQEDVMIMVSVSTQTTILFTLIEQLQALHLYKSALQWFSGFKLH